MKPMIDEMDKRWVCPKCDGDSTNESGMCERCLEEVSDEMKIPVDVIKEYADDTQDFDLSDIEETYAGQFDNDEEFAREQVEQCGDLPRNNHWLPNYIDWEY